MRISDWSSDVCSSDLPGERVQAPSFWIDDHADRIIAHGQATDQTAPHLNFFRPGMADIEAVEDRKSVGSGTSVSVRVDLGGRRIIKKKRRKKLTPLIKHLKVQFKTISYIMCVR